MLNAVGFYNYKFFLLTLLYACVALALTAGLSFQRLTEIGAEQPAARGFAMLTAGHSLFLLATLGGFLAFHIFLVSRNITTIEFIEGDDSKSCYDLGFAANWIAVLGPQPSAWLLPVGGSIGDGLSFPVRPPAEKSWSSLSRSVTSVEA